MRRISLVLSSLFLLAILGVALLLSGLIFTPFLRPLERYVGKTTPVQLSVGRVHLSPRGEIVISQVALRMKLAGLANFPEVRLSPRWAALLKGSFQLHRVVIVEPTVTWDPSLLSPPNLPTVPRGEEPTSTEKTLAAIVAIGGDLEIVRGRVFLSHEQKLPESLYPINLHCLVAGEKIRIETFDLKMGKGVMTGEGDVFVGSGSLDLKIQTKNFPLDQLARAFVTVPSAVRLDHSGNWQVSKRQDRWEMSSQGQLGHGLGTVASKPKVSFRVSFAGKAGELAVQLTSFRMKASAHGTFDLARQSVDIHFDATASEVEAFSDLWPPLAEARGSVTMSGRAVGPWHSPEIQIKATGHALHYGGMVLEQGQAILDKKGESLDSLTLHVTGSSLTWTSTSGSQYSVPQAELGWFGDLNQGNLSLNVRLVDGTSLVGDGRAHLKDQGLNWRWATLRATLRNGTEWKAGPGGVVDLTSAGAVAVHDLRIGKENNSLKLSLLSIDQGQLQVNASADHFSFAFKPLLNGATTPVEGVLSGDIQLEGPIDSPAGHFDLRISSGSFGTLTSLAIRSHGVVKEAHITIEDAVATVGSLPAIRAHGFVPWSWIMAEAPPQPMDLSLEAGPLDPADLAQTLSNVELKPGGSIELKGRMRGRKGNLKVEGSLLAFVPSFKMPSLGVDVQEARFDMELDHQHLLIRKAEAKLGKGTLRVTGESDLPSLHYELRGEQVSVQSRRSFDLKTDLRLALEGTLEAPTLSGEIQVKEGTYDRTKKKKDDQKEETSESAPTPDVWYRLLIDVKAHWDSHVWYRDGLTKIETAADLEVLKNRGEKNIGFLGHVTVVRGNYDAYGRDFVLKSGEVTFIDPSEINPQLNISATHKMTDALVELDVTGTAQKPELRLSSTPPMPEQDILSMLALGKAPGQASGNGSKTPAGAELAADVVSNYLTREVRSSGMNVLDLDVIRVSPSEKGQEWTVGRYWGSKLFLSYSYNPENMSDQLIKAEYSLSPRWILVGQSGSSDDYLDINFRLPVGKPRD